MSLRVMLFVGCMILVLGHFMSRLTPMTTSQEKLIPPAGTSTVNHGDMVSTSLATSRLAHPGVIDSHEKVDIPRR